MSIYLFTMWLNQKQTVWFTGDLVDVKRLRAVERALEKTSRHVKSYRCLERVQLLDRPPHAHTYLHTHTTGWDQQLKAFQQAPPSPLSQAELSCSRVTLSWLRPHHKTPSPSCTPVLLVCNGAWWQMRSFDTQTEIQEQANKKKNKTLSAFLFLCLCTDAILWRRSRDLSACTRARPSHWCLTQYFFPLSRLHNIVSVLSVMRSQLLSLWC